MNSTLFVRQYNKCNKYDTLSYERNIKQMVPE